MMIIGDGDGDAIGISQSRTAAPVDISAVTGVKVGSVEELGFDLDGVFGRLTLARRQSGKDFGTLLYLPPEICSSLHPTHTLP